MSSTPIPAEAESRVGGWRELAPLALVALTIAGVAAAFVAPWLPKPSPGGASLEHYAPMRDGAARLTVSYDGDGKVKQWVSGNDRILPPAAGVVSELRDAQRDALGKFLAQPGEKPLNAAQIMERLAKVGTLYRTREYTLEADGKLRESTSFSIRDTRGDFLLSIYFPADDLDVTFERPLHVLGSEFKQGAQWESKGLRVGGGGSVSYEYSGKALGLETLQADGLEYRDCAKVETRIRIFNQEKTLFENRTLYWFAPRVGIVQWQNFDPAGKVTERTVLVSDATMRLPTAAPPPVKAEASAPPKFKPDAPWELTRFAPGRPGFESASATVLPTWIDSTPPLLLTAQGSELAALNTTGDHAGQVAWRFRPAGDIYGAPTWDAARGRIYFGAADKRLYALDSRGLYLWSFATGDNIATRPVVAGHTVIIGSEDRRIYGVDAASGREKWHADTGAAVVGSPVAIDGLVAIGSDDGIVYALEPEKGEQRWTYESGSPIEAPLALAGDRIIVCDREGAVSALSTETGKPEWTANLDGVIDSRPAIAGDRVFLTKGGRVFALLWKDGAQIGETRDEGYFGTPEVFENSLVVARTGGKVARLSFDGRKLGEWATDDGGGFNFGVATGGGACWLVQRDGVVRRLGPETAGAKPLKLAWAKSFGTAPFGINMLNVTPVPYGDKAVLVDSGRDVYLVDPSGKGDVKKLGSIGAADEKPSVNMDPALAGDTLAATIGTKLYAIKLPDAKPLWSFEGQGTSLRPPTAAGDLFLWVVQRAEAKDGAPAQGVLFAIDAQTGQPRWQQPLQGFGGPGGAVRGGDTVYTSTPPAAFDAATGVPKWQGKAPGLAMGGPALSEAGDRLYVGLTDKDGKPGTLASLDAKTGGVVWQKSLGDTTINAVDHAWPVGELVIVPLWSGEILALGASDGAEKWRYKPAKPRLGCLTVEGPHVWLMQQNMEVAALAVATGEPRARFSLDKDVSSFRAFAPRPVIVAGRLLAPLTLIFAAFEVPMTK